MGNYKDNTLSSEKHCLKNNHRVSQRRKWCVAAAVAWTTLLWMIVDLGQWVTFISLCELAGGGLCLDVCKCQRHDIVFIDIASKYQKTKRQIISICCFSSTHLLFVTFSSAFCFIHLFIVIIPRSLLSLSLSNQWSGFNIIIYKYSLISLPQCQTEEVSFLSFPPLFRFSSAF